MATTPIEWTATVNPDGSVTPGKTWNPVTGCHKVSPGCKHCYAEGIAKRFWKTQYPPVDARPREFGDVQTHADRLTEPFSWKRPCKVFVNSMSDLFEEAVPFEVIAAVFAVMSYCDRHTFQVLTKRPGRMREFMEWVDAPEGCERITELYGDRAGEAITMARMHRVDEAITFKVWADHGVDLDACLHNNGVWPPENVWLGVSVENQQYADERIPILLDTPAAVRFISYEPALAAVTLQQLTEQVGDAYGDGAVFVNALTGERWMRDGIEKEQAPTSRLDWVIVGGESGPGARPFDVEWARSIVHQCRAAGVACFVKQLGAQPTGWWSNALGPAINGRTFKHKKGGDIQEWPEDLRVRQFPEARA